MIVILLPLNGEKGKSVLTWLEWDADHAHNTETRRSITSILFYMNGTLVKWSLSANILWKPILMEVN